MAVDGEEALLAIVDRVYESVERPELWPETICAVGDFLGGRRHFWGLDPGAQVADVDLRGGTDPFEIGCYGTFFLSRMDLQALDEYAQEFGDLIIRFLKIVFLSMLRSQKDVRAREAIGLKMAQRYLQASEALQGSPVVSSMSVGRKLIAALWEDGRVFSSANLRWMRLIAPSQQRTL